MTRIVFLDIPENAGRDLDIERRILGPDVDIAHVAFTGDDTEIVSLCAAANVIVTDFVPFTRTTIEKLNNCELIAVAATGFNSIDVAAAADNGINVCAIDEYCTDEVADHAVLLMLALSRRLTEYHAQVQQDRSWRFDSLTGLRRMSDQTLGIIGFGRIGQAVARRAVGFGMQVLAFDPYPSEEAASALGAELCDLAELYARADIVSLNCGLSAATERLVDAAAFAAMSRKPFLINCARGGLVDEEALVAALDGGQISGAGLDVLEAESPDLDNSGLTGRHNVILTPHVAFYSDASMRENREITAGNIRNFLDGEHARVRKYIHRVA